jgi:hypothetical protein
MTMMLVPMIRAILPPDVNTVLSLVTTTMFAQMTIVTTPPVTHLDAGTVRLYVKIMTFALLRLVFPTPVKGAQAHP